MMEAKMTEAKIAEAEQPLHDKHVERVVSNVKARQGSRTLVNRDVLIWSLVLVILAFAAVYVWTMLR